MFSDGDFLNVFAGNDLTLWKQIQSIFFLVETPELDNKDTSSDEGEDSEDTVVPDQKRIGGKWVQSLGNGGGDGIGEQGDGLDQRSHVLGRLGVGVFE